MPKEGRMIGVDFQGWPVYAKTLRQILTSLGATEHDGVVGFKTDDKILDIYPMTLEDDGMGYGVNEKFVTEASASRDAGYISMFIQKEEEV